MKKVMRISSFKLACLALAGGAMIFFTSCEKEETVVNQDQNLTIKTDSQNRASGPSASGHGTLSLEEIPIVGEGFRQFTFHAREKNNGNVEGSGVLTYAGGVLNLKFDIDCLTVIGNRAIMTGVVTRNNQNPANEGLLAYFEVTDNGEGSNAAPDQISLFFSGTDPGTYDCANDFGLVNYDIEGGNIQVRE